MNMLQRRGRQAVKLLRLLPEPVFRRGLRFGVGASVEHRTVIDALPVRTVIDIGANVGQFSLLARALHPEARIVAFEPMAEAAARFRRLFAGDAAVTLHQAAIAPEAGRVTMHISASADCSSLLPMSARQEEIFPGTAEIGTETVETGPLTDFIAAERIVPPALLKIDVQGFELEVLRGCEPVLDRFVHVYVEASFMPLYEGQALAGEVADFLENRGFVEVGRYNESRDAAGRPVQADFLFRRAVRGDDGANVHLL